MQVSVFWQVADLFPGTTSQSRGRTDTLEFDGTRLVFPEGLTFLLRTTFIIEIEEG